MRQVLIPILALFILIPSSLAAKIYIDITSPALRQLPIAIQDFKGHPSGKEISEIVRADLEYTGLFSFIDEEAYLESPEEPFHPENWKPLGIEIVVKGTVVMGELLFATISLYDAIEVKGILKKRYSAKKDLLRTLSHEISKTIYEKVTGQKGIFTTKIAFVSKDRDRKAIYIMDWDGHRIRRILGIRKDALIMTPHWSSDGGKLVYSSERNRKWGVYMINFSNMREYLAYSSEGTNLTGDFTPDGNYLTLSSSKQGSPDIYLLHIKTKVLSRLTYSSGIEISPSVSPEGNEIVFFFDRAGTPQLYMMNIDGNNPRRITYDGSYNTSPDWSPSGNRIVFCGRIGKKMQLFTIRSDGTDLVQLTYDGNNEAPSFSPDGRFIAFTSDREGTKGIFIMRTNGEGQQRVSPKNLRVFGPAWSPR